MALAAVVLLLVFFAGTEAVDTLEVSQLKCSYNHWDEGGTTVFQGEITILGNQATADGWLLQLAFDQDVWDVNPYSHATVQETIDSKNVVLQNVDYAKTFYEGQERTFQFAAKTQGSPPGCDAWIVGNNEAASGSTTSSSTTTPTTATTTTTSSSEGTTTTDNTNSGSDFGNADYTEALHKSILFYEAQRSGHLPDDNRIDWRGDSALNDGQDVGVDLTGGWYDAGDHVKFGFPMAASVTILAWGIDKFWDGYVEAGELDWALDCIKWPLDYFIKAHVSDNKFYGQVGNGGLDHSFWGRAEDMTMSRPAYYVDDSQGGADLVGETATAMAASYIVFERNGNTEYANQLLAHARTLFNFAWTYQTAYTNQIWDAGSFYNSWSGYEDELTYAAMWLYKATGESDYLQKAQSKYPYGTPKFFSWDDKKVGAQLLFHELDPSMKTPAEGEIKTFLDNWANGKNGITITPKGLSWGDQWGPLRYAANAAFVALVAAEQNIEESSAVSFAKKQIHYMLGSTGRSFVCGYGINPPVKPHHRGSSCEADKSCDINDAGANPNVLEGALVGGPDSSDNYEDKRDDYISNEVACDYNAGFQSALAGLIHFNLKAR